MGYINTLKYFWVDNFRASLSLNSKIVETSTPQSGASRYKEHIYTEYIKAAFDIDADDANYVTSVSHRLTHTHTHTLTNTHTHTQTNTHTDTCKHVKLYYFLSNSVAMRQ